MKIAFFSHYDSLYGANKSLLALLTGINNRKISCIVFLPMEGAFSNELAKNNIPYYVIPFKWWVHYQRGYTGFFYKRWLQYLYYQLLSLKKICVNIYFSFKVLAICKKEGISIVHSNSYTISFGFFIAKLGCIPHVWHLREYGELDYKMFPDFGYWLTYRLIKKSNAVICISNSIEKHFHLEKHKTSHVIYNGIFSHAEFIRNKTISKRLLFKEAKVNLVMVGLVRSYKGHEDAVMATALLLKETKNIYLNIVGTGDTKEIKKLAETLGISDRVIFKGYIPCLDEVFDDTDALLMCSKNEAMGRVTVESMSYGRPVIGYDSAGTSELIKNGETGLLYQNGPFELASCIKTLIEDEVKRNYIIQNAFDFAIAEFTNESYTDNVTMVYNKILNIG